MNMIIKNIQEVAPYQGEHAIPGIRFRAVRQALEVSAWGMNVLEFDPACEGYPAHEHVEDGQEEVYVVLDGSIVLVVDGTERTLRRGDMARVPPHRVRKFVTRSEPATLLAIGGTPGKPYAADRRMATT
jgi:mannose-6-phosphate isomerase-like protein (cupin superfamily)